MKRNRKITNILIYFVAAIIIAAFLYAIYYSTSKAGFGFSSKTLMDWIELLIIPVTLAIAAFLINNFEKERDNERALDQKREDALQHYFDKVTEIIRSNKELSEEDLSFIRIRTLTVLRMLDGERKAFIIKFLFETNLIVNKTTIFQNGDNRNSEIKPARINLFGADLSGINLKGVNFFIKEHLSDCSNFWEIDLSGSDLSYANLEGSEMSGANFSGSRLNHANLTKLKATSGNFTNVEFNYANLSGANLGSGNFLRARFFRSKCKGTSFSYSSFIDTSHPNGGNPFIDQANFSNAQLSFTNFDEANILPDQLKNAAVFWKTRLPGFSLYSGFHPLFSIVPSTPNIERDHWINDANVEKGVCGCKEAILVDTQKIENEISDLIHRHRHPIQKNLDLEILKALWVKYEVHLLRIYSKSIFTRILYIFTEYDPPTYVPGENLFQKKIREVRDGIKFWKTYDSRNEK